MDAVLFCSHPEADQAKGCGNSCPGRLYQRYRLALLCTVAIILSQSVICPAFAYDFAYERNSESSYFLVAADTMSDPRFRQTVLIVTKHSRSGNVGLILNKPTKMSLAEMFPDNPYLRGMSDSIYHGGPIRHQSLIYMFQAAEHPPNAIHIHEDIYLSYDPSSIADHLQGASPGLDLRIYAGFASWAPGQLESEVARGDWFKVRTDTSKLFQKNPRKLWGQLIATLYGSWI